MQPYQRPLREGLQSEDEQSYLRRVQREGVSRKCGALTSYATMCMDVRDQVTVSAGGQALKCELGFNDYSLAFCLEAIKKFEVFVS